MTHEEKLQYAINRYGKIVRYPGMYRLLYVLGIKLPPPVFQSFPGLICMDLLLIFLPFTVIEVFLLLLWSDADAPFQLFGERFWWVLLAGILIGCLDWLYQRHKARQHKIPRWKAIPEESASEAAD